MDRTNNLKLWPPKHRGTAPNIRCAHGHSVSRCRTDTPWAVLSVHRRKLGRIDSLQRWSLRQTTNPAPVRPSRTRLSPYCWTPQSRSLIIQSHFTSTSASSPAILQFTRTVSRLHMWICETRRGLWWGNIGMICGFACSSFSGYGMVLLIFR